MRLAPGHRLGSYEIVDSLGAGGMGEVYRARDTSLQRDVAIKVLPDLVAGDPDRVRRLTQEARALAALNHPNIAHVHGLDDTGSGRALVMELVEGEDLSQRVARGALPIAEALTMARQIADALEAAHEQGIVHRDLKPANIRVRPDGTVKVLDFGLAKAAGPDADISGLAAESPTLTAASSGPGTIVGSAAYMAPEQARGQAVDKRADIWAFGAVLYEMLTGARAFDGETLSDVLAAVLRREVDWSRLPSATPPRVRHLLERCLTIDVKQRLRDIGEARVALAAPDDPASTTRPPRSREWLAWTVAAVAIVVAVAALVRTRTSAPGSASGGVTRLSVLAPPGLRLNPDSANVAISPDGRTVALVVGTSISAENQLWIRSLDSPVPRRIESGDGVSLPFWSPDGKRIGFFAARKLKVVPAAGGPAEVICDAPFARGATWNRGNVIVFAPDAQGPLYRVPATGGTPVPATRLDPSGGARGSHRFPHFLPDGDHFLFAAVPGGDQGFEIFAGSLQNAEAIARIGTLDSAPVYTDPGWLLFGRQGVLTAQRFDARTLTLRGEPLSLGDQPGVAPPPATYEAGPQVSTSASGALAYYLPIPAATKLQWMNAAGQALAAIDVPPGRYTSVSVAPDDTRAVLVRAEPGIGSSLWLVDLARAGAVPLVTEGRNTSPVWSPDGREVAFASDRAGQHGFYVKRALEAASERKIATFKDRTPEPRGWTHDGTWLLFNRVDPQTRWNVYRLLAAGGGEPELLIGGPAIEAGARTSPDDRWLAYFSDEGGRLDAFVRTVDPSGPKVQVSSGGAQFAFWTRDARQMLFVKRDLTLWRVPIDLSGAAPRLGALQQLGAFPPGIVSLDLARDGRFLAIVADRADTGTIAVVQSWQP